jgi:hypothetical protein
MGDWIKRNWRTSTGAAVADMTLWQSLIEASKKFSRIEWSCVRAQSDLLLNECSDVLATQGVNNEQSPNGQQQVLLPREDDDTDEQEYVLANGEETLNEDWMAEHPPASTMIWKNGTGIPNNNNNNIYVVRPPGVASYTEALAFARHVYQLKFSYMPSGVKVKDDISHSGSGPPIHEPPGLKTAQDLVGEMHSPQEEARSSQDERQMDRDGHPEPPSSSEKGSSTSQAQSSDNSSDFQEILDKKERGRNPIRCSPQEKSEKKEDKPEEK